MSVKLKCRWKEQDKNKNNNNAENDSCASTSTSKIQQELQNEQKEEKEKTETLGRPTQLNETESLQIFLPPPENPIQKLPPLEEYNQYCQQYQHQYHQQYYAFHYAQQQQQQQQQQLYQNQMQQYFPKLPQEQQQQQQQQAQKYLSKPESSVNEISSSSDSKIPTPGQNSISPVPGFSEPAKNLLSIPEVIFHLFSEFHTKYNTTKTKNFTVCESMIKISSLSFVVCGL